MHVKRERERERERGGGTGRQTTDTQTDRVIPDREGVEEALRNNKLPFCIIIEVITENNI